MGKRGNELLLGPVRGLGFPLGAAQLMSFGLEFCDLAAQLRAHPGPCLLVRVRGSRWDLGWT